MGSKKYEKNKVCFATEEQAKLAIKMLNKTKQYVANEYKHRKQTKNLNYNTKEEDKRYKKSVEEKHLQETITINSYQLQERKTGKEKT